MNLKKKEKKVKTFYLCFLSIWKWEELILLSDTEVSFLRGLTLLDAIYLKSLNDISKMTLKTTQYRNNSDVISKLERYIIMETGSWLIWISSVPAAFPFVVKW